MAARRRAAAARAALAGLPGGVPPATVSLFENGRPGRGRLRGCRRGHHVVVVAGRDGRPPCCPESASSSLLTSFGASSPAVASLASARSATASAA
eukprot:5934061-Alexandrium_andersonii.AAC.1